jgi:hypothetical protein
MRPSCDSSGVLPKNTTRMSEERTWSMTAMGHSRPINTPPAVASCPLGTESGQNIRRLCTSALCQSRLNAPQMRAANGRARLHSGGSEGGRLGRQPPGIVFRTGVTMHQWLPSQRAIKLDCIIVEQIPARTIAASSERGLTTFLTPKGRNYGPGGNEQSDGRSIKRSRGHRLRSSGYHGPSVDIP